MRQPLFACLFVCLLPEWSVLIQKPLGCALRQCNCSPAHSLMSVPVRCYHWKFQTGALLGWALQTAPGKHTRTFPFLPLTFQCLTSLKVFLLKNIYHTFVLETVWFTEPFSQVKRLSCENNPQTCNYSLTCFLHQLIMAKCHWTLYRVWYLPWLFLWKQTRA